MLLIPSLKQPPMAGLYFVFVGQLNPEINSLGNFCQIMAESVIVPQCRPLIPIQCRNLSETGAGPCYMVGI